MRGQEEEEEEVIEEMKRVIDYERAQNVEE